MKDGRDKSQLKLLWDFVTYILKIEPKIFISFFIVTISSAISTVLLVYLPKIIIDGIMGNLGFGEFISNLLKYSILIIIFMTIGDYSNNKFIKDRSYAAEKFGAEFSKKVMNIKYELLEDPEVLDLRERAKYPLDQMLIFAIMDNLRNGGIAVARLIGVGGILASFNIWLMLFAIVMCLIGGIYLERSSVINERFARDLMPINRRYNYYLGILYQPAFQKEYRLYNLNELVEKKLKLYMDITLNRLQEVYTESMKVDIINNALIAITRFVIYLYTALRVLGIGGGAITLGTFSIILTANEQFAQSITALLHSGISIKRDIRFLEPLFDFYNLEDYGVTKGLKKAEPLKTLEFKNVNFTYPKSDRAILNDINFKLDRGETLALVGKNNAGKSTIVKLIARLFEPTEGEILWNGINIKELDLKSYLSELAYVFQDFQPFPFKLWENVASYSNSNSEDIPKNVELKVMDCIERVGMKEAVEELPYGLNTWLSKYLHDESTEFSGGQSQKIAMARAIYKDASFAVLDEPTAALDPLAESEVYENFSNLVRDKTALFISHRMSASRFCDRILVLDNGKIIGNGNHEKLIETNELYNSLYQAQAQYYK